MLSKWHICFVLLSIRFVVDFNIKVKSLGLIMILNWYSENDHDPYTLKTIPEILHATKEGIADVSYLKHECDHGHNDRLLDCRVYSTAVDTIVLDTIITGIVVEDKKCIVFLCGEGDNCVSFVTGEDPVEFTLEVWLSWIFQSRNFVEKWLSSRVTWYYCWNLINTNMYINYC